MEHLFLGACCTVHMLGNGSCRNPSSKGYSNRKDTEALSSFTPCLFPPFRDAAAPKAWMPLAFALCCPHDSRS
jgi:hypothetical protein